MRYDSDDAFKLYVPCAILFALGFLGKLFGIVGFVIVVGIAFVVARYLSVWMRSRFEIQKATPEDRLDMALRQESFGDALESLLHGKPKN